MMPALISLVNNLFDVLKTLISGKIKRRYESILAYIIKD